MASYLITSCARGLGLAMATQLATLPSSDVDRIFVTARGESTALRTLIQSSAGRIQFIKMDASKESSIKAAVVEVNRILEGQGLDVLINNTGQYSARTSIMTMKEIDDQLSNNIVTLHQVTRKFLPLLKKGELKKVINIAPEVGSAAKKGDHASFPVPTYKTSKAALNALTVQYSMAYAEEGFTFLAMSPDWLPIGLSTNVAIEEGAKAALLSIMDAGMEESGKILTVRIEGWESPSLVTCR